MLHGTRAFLSELCKADKMKRLGYHRRLDFHFICFTEFVFYLLAEKEISEAIPDLSGTKYLGRWAANIIPVEIAQLNYSMRKKGAMKDDADDK